MDHVFVEVIIKGRKKSKKLKKVMVDTGATRSFFPEKVLKEVDAEYTGEKATIELADRRKKKVKYYFTKLTIKGRICPDVVASFEDAPPVTGCLTLEALGLRVNPLTSKLEPTRPKGLAYFY